MKICLRMAVLALCLLAVPVLEAESQFFNIEKVADGVYAAIGKPGVASNGAFIITDEGVLVVDTHFRPSWARDLIAEIRKITDKPVRYVVNTHWHNDHTQGNVAYFDAFPRGTEFISHHATRDDIIDKAIPSIAQTLKTLPEQIARAKERLEKGVDPQGHPLDDAGKENLKNQIASQEAYLGELKDLTITIPNLTFEKSLILHKKDKQIQVLYFGKGHTRGDVVVYLPKEKVIVTGDLLTGGLPFMRDAYPSMWAPTLEAIGQLDFTKVIPGHGPVEDGKDRLNLVVTYLKDLIAAVKAQVEKGATLDDAKKNVLEALTKYEKDFPGGNFRNALTGPNGNIEKTYQEFKDAKK